VTGMRNLFKIVALGLAVIAFYTLFGSLYFPEEPPEAESRTEEAASVSTTEDLVALGRKVFHGKGGCTLCHRPSGRADVLDRVAAVAEERIKDSHYKGSATDALGYIFESMLEPSAYVLKGYGVAGTGDTVSPMPPVNGPAIGLTDMEIRAVAAYLQKTAGVEVTVTPETPLTHGRKKN